MAAAQGISLQRQMLGFAGGVAAAAAVALSLPAVQSRAIEQEDNQAWRMRAAELTAFLDGDERLAGTRLEALATLITRLAEARFSETPQRLTTKSFRPEHFEYAEARADERRCLAQAIYYEARSEPLRGQFAVAEVVMNRVRSRLYPNDICGVVYEGSERTTGCQFTFTCDGSLARTPRGRAWERSRAIAAHSQLGYAQAVTNRATHYHTVAVNPFWSETLERVDHIGTHIFYRFPRRTKRTPA